MDSLKPCPFCGGEAQTLRTGSWWCVACKTPFCCDVGKFDTEAEAIEAWNTRMDFGAREKIVRCRDCKYMHNVRNWLGIDVDECWLHADRESGALGKDRTEPNGFCSWGERKEANEDD